MASVDGPRQRTRVGGGTTISNSAGSLAVMMPPQGSMSLASSPSPRLKVQQPMATSDTRPSSAKQKRVEAAPARAATPPSMPAATPQATYSSASPRAAYSSVNPQASYSSSAPQATFSNASLRAAYSGVSPQAPYSSAAPQSCSNYSMPEPPAPRSWTPSQLGSSGGCSGSTTRSMTPAEALEKEMQELCSVNPGSAANATGFAQQRPSSCGTPTGTATSYKNPFFESSAACNARDRAGLGVRPASSGGAPLAAQHNNLMMSPMSPRVAGRPGSTGSNRPSREDFLPTQLGLAKLKTKLVGHGSKPGVSSTAVEAFEEPTIVGVAASDSNDPVVVARRRGTAPARLQPSSYSRTTSQWEQEAMALLNAGDRLAVLQLPGPSSGVVRCYIKCVSNRLGMGQHFELRLESTDECLAVARRRVKSATSSYVIGLAGSSCSSGSSTPSSHGHREGSSSPMAASLRRDDPEVVGKLKANMMGTQYLLRGRGGNSSVHKGFNAQLLAVSYKPTINHMQAAPRTMTAILPVPESKVWDGSQPLSGQFEDLTGCMEAARERQLPPSYERDLVMLHTMKPHFDANKQVHYLDFKGRAHECSLKNFQLVHWDHNRNQLGTDLVLLFGKKERREYAVDFCYPMSALQAFALGLSSIDSKLCYAV